MWLKFSLVNYWECFFFQFKKGFSLENLKRISILLMIREKLLFNFQFAHLQEKIFEVKSWWLAYLKRVHYISLLCNAALWPWFLLAPVTHTIILGKVGTKKKGNDGNMWQVKTTKAGVKRWTKITWIYQFGMLFISVCSV